MPPTELEDRVRLGRTVNLQAVRDRFPAALARFTLGIISGRPDGFYLGPMALIQLGAVEESEDAVRWPVVGGLLSRRPGGWVGFEVRDGELRGFLSGWTPALPRWLYDLTQRPLHHELTRLYLLQVRGRTPLPGPEAPQERRRAALAIDLGLCLLVAGRRPRRFLGVAAGYHVAAWAMAGQTVGGGLLGLRLRSVDGSRLTLGQAVARLLLLPLGRRRQDALAGTAVIPDAGAATGGRSPQRPPAPRPPAG